MEDLKMEHGTGWHALGADEVYRALSTDENGISPGAADDLLERHGPNALTTRKNAGAAELLFKQLKSPLIYLLAAAAVVSSLTSHYADAAVIGAVILLNTALGFFQEYKAEKALESLRKMTSPRARVLRDGKAMTIDAAEIVPGDVLVLETGDSVAADARVVVSGDLEVDESILTGESEAVLKGTVPVDKEAALADRTNMVFKSTSVTGGRGRAVVTATGMNTELGRIAGQVEAAGGDDTPLQKRMGRLGLFLGMAGVGFAGIVFLLGVLTGYDVLEMVLFSVAVAVSAIPEGLPAVISVTLALGVRRMAVRQAVIRSLPAVETLGSTTVICSDKTGTITRNEMTVTRLFAGGRRYTVSGEGYAAEGDIRPEGGDGKNGPMPDADLGRLLRIGILANNARLSGREGAWEFEGSATEKAILVCSVKGLGGEAENLRKTGRGSEIPFSSAAKYMAVRTEEEGGGNICVKGAPERILDFCSHVLVDGSRRELDAGLRRRIAEENDAMAEKALRVVAAAEKEAPGNPGRLEPHDVEEGLVFVGMWGMIDPPREDAVEAIGQAKRAGIHVVMITGDHAVTAAAVARKAGIAPGGSRAVTGREIDAMEDGDLVKAAFETGVFARVSPAHKLRILDALRARGEIVAMTGDGVNDAPALKGADIGVAMGITGTEVAKGAADMVLLDDNFATIVHAVEEGRGIFNNLRRVIFFLLATNLGEVLTLAASLALGLPLPLTAIMILWINLVTDGACTIPLGVEPRHLDVLESPPRNPRDPVLTTGLLVRLGILASVMTAGTILFFMYELKVTSLVQARTAAFTALAAFQWFQAFNARSSRRSVFSVGFFSNRWVLIGIGGAVLLQVLAVQTQAGNLVFGTVPLGLSDWLLIVLVSSSIWAADELLKLIGLYERFDRKKK